MPKICLIEDDGSLRAELAHLLELQGFSCVAPHDFAGAAQWVLEESPDCVVLDLHLPQSDGFTLCRDIRAQSSTPILVLTSSDSEFDEVMSMNLGADDYLTKPYRPAVLVARIRALLRRAGVDAQHVLLSHDGVTLDVATGVVSYEGSQAELTRNEQRILAMLMAQPGVIMTRQEIMCELWDSDAFVDDNTLTVNVARVRKALESIGVPYGFIQTKRGLGYRVQI